MGVSPEILIFLLALAGTGFIASAYPVLQNFISRSFLSLQYRVGDMISIGGYMGKVIEITDLNTVLLDEEGNLANVPNVLFQKEIWTKYQVSGYEVTAFTAMTYAELSSAIPEAGGGYLWVKHSLPGINGFLSGWMSWFAHAVAGSLYALGFGAYFGMLLETYNISLFGLSGDHLTKFLAVAIALVFIYINYMGASETGAIANFRFSFS